MPSRPEVHLAGQLTGTEGCLEGRCLGTSSRSPSTPSSPALPSPRCPARACSVACSHTRPTLPRQIPKPMHVNYRRHRSRRTQDTQQTRTQGRLLPRAPHPGHSTRSCTMTRRSLREGVRLIDGFLFPGRVLHHRRARFDADAVRSGLRLCPSSRGRTRPLVQHGACVLHRHPQALSIRRRAVTSIRSEWSTAAFAAISSSFDTAGYTPKTTSRRLSAVRTLFKYLNVQGVTQLNPACPRHPRPVVGTRLAAQDE